MNEGKVLDDWTLCDRAILSEQGFDFIALCLGRQVSNEDLHHCLGEQKAEPETHYVTLEIKVDKLREKKKHGVKLYTW